MCSESFPKEFEKTTEVLPFTKYGLSSIKEFKDAEKDVHHLEWLKNAGLTDEEIKLYEENEVGLLGNRKKIESNALKEKLQVIYKKIDIFGNKNKSSDEEVQPSTSNDSQTPKMEPLKVYPEGHPMNSIKEMEENLFGHLKTEMIPLTKRRKILRHLERRKERIAQRLVVPTAPHSGEVKPGSLWDVKEVPKRKERQEVIGPKKQTMYTVKENKIVRLEPVNQEEQDYRAVDIVMPVNDAEAQLLEGTKMCIDDIKKIDRFKDYEPGVPSKILYLKNISPTVSEDQISILFNQFMLANGGPIEVRLMTGRMRGQAFVAFQNEDIAIQALEETNGTILSGRPIIAEFGRNTNRIQDNG